MIDFAFFKKNYVLYFDLSLRLFEKLYLFWVISCFLKKIKIRDYFSYFLKILEREKKVHFKNPISPSTLQGKKGNLVQFSSNDNTESTTSMKFSFQTYKIKLVLMHFKVYRQFFVFSKKKNLTGLMGFLKSPIHLYKNTDTLCHCKIFY